MEDAEVTGCRCGWGVLGLERCGCEVICDVLSILSSSVSPYRGNDWLTSIVEIMTIRRRYYFVPNAARINLRLT